MKLPEYQYNLRTTFVGVGIIALLLSCWSWYGWWMETRHMRRLHGAIMASTLSAEDKSLLGSLAWNPHAWESGLIDDLIVHATIKRIVWSSAFLRDGRRYSVYLLDSLVKPTAGAYFPITCVVTTTKYDLVTWDKLAVYSEGFIDAALAADGTLSLTTKCNWCDGNGMYTYLVTSDGVSSVGSPQFVFFKDRERIRVSPRLHQDDERLRKTIDELRERIKLRANV